MQVAIIHAAGVFCRKSPKTSDRESRMHACCILSGQIKGNTVPISAIWHRSDGELCHYLDTGTVWLKLLKAHPPPSNLKRSRL